MLTTTTPEITLTEEQLTAITLINTWFVDSPNQEYKLGGYAGTGKTTIIRSLIDSLRAQHTTVVVCAFTGKAVNVLTHKSIRAQTLHSLMYDCYQDPQTRQLIFTKKTSLGSVDIIIVDEASMLSTELYNDLKSYHIKILFVGDPGQLEPVGDNPNLMARPDFVLSKIHRQAEASPIIILANNVRTGAPSCLTPTRHGLDADVVIRGKALTPEQLLTFSQFICARNVTRQTMNTAVRNYLRRPPLSIVPGDKLIVLHNNLSFGVFNGMIVFVDEIINEGAECWITKVHDEVNNYYTLDIWKKPFQIVMKKGTYESQVPRKFVFCDFAYAITCHKSQGSEWDRVVVWDEFMPPSVWCMKRWRYTAITRAAKQLLYLV